MKKKGRSNQAPLDIWLKIVSPVVLASQRMPGSSSPIRLFLAATPVAKAALSVTSSRRTESYVLVATSLEPEHGNDLLLPLLFMSPTIIL